MNIPERFIPLKERMADREYLVKGSFISSGALLAQTSQWFSNGSREGPCLMQFHQEWRNENCPVMKWYRLQQASSTAFRFIQHRKESEPPFFHEFLLLQLNDGAVCRVDRTGHGSRLDAIQHTGCIANDYIQHFPATTYEACAFNKPSELIAEVHFPHDLDIMDVLAICFAIYSRPRTRTYTLQRFNCYFFCNTILMALSRRFLEWDAAFTLDTWENALSQALDQLTQIFHDPASEHLVLRVCRLLEPDNSEPADFFLRAFRDRLGGEPDAYNSLKSALSKTLWQNSWVVRMSRSIAGHINAAVAVALDGESNCAQVLRSATRDRKKALQEKHETFAIVNKIFNRKATVAMYDGIHLLTEASEERYRLEKIENPRSIFRYAWISLAARALGLWFPIQMLMAGDMEEWGLKEMLLSSPRGIITAQELGRLQSRRKLTMIASNGPTILVGKTMAITTAATASPYLVQVNCDMAACSLDKTLKKLADRGMLTSSNITIALYATMSKNIWDDWLNKSFRDLLGAGLSDMHLEDKEILVKIPKTSGGFIELKSVFQYQEYMHQRIESHAKRLENYHLAAARLVSEDIHEAMATIWGLIPQEYASSMTTCA